MRRAPAIAPIETPPTSPIRRNRLKYPPQRRANVARKRYDATRRDEHDSFHQAPPQCVEGDVLAEVCHGHRLRVRWLTTRPRLVLTPLRGAISSGALVVMRWRSDLVHSVSDTSGPEFRDTMSRLLQNESRASKVGRDCSV